MILEIRLETRKILLRRKKYNLNLLFYVMPRNILILLIHKPAYYYFLLNSII